MTVGGGVDYDQVDDIDSTLLAIDREVQRHAASIDMLIVQQLRNGGDDDDRNTGANKEVDAKLMEHARLMIQKRREAVRRNAQPLRTLATRVAKPLPATLVNLRAPGPWNDRPGHPVV